MVSITLAFGRGTVEFEVPDEHFLGHVRPRPVTALDDVHEAVHAALADPIGSKPLSEMAAGADSVLILTVDYTRPSPRPLLEPVLELLEQASVRATIAIAAGRHRPMAEDEMVQHLGRQICSTYPIIQHDSFDPAAHVNRGRTSRGTPIKVNSTIFEYDLVLAVGVIEPTYLAGFSGSRKMLMPGMAWHEAIDANHYLITDPACRVGVLDGNPISEDMEEFARDLPLDFIVYSVVGPNDEDTAIVAGDRYQAHRVGCRLSEQIFRVPGPMADIIISSAGGYPYDCDLVQGKKTIIPAYELVKPGGAIVMVSETEEGWGAEGTFVKWLKELTPEEIVVEVMKRDLFSLGAHGARILAKPVVDRQAAVFALVGEHFVHELEGTFVRATSDPAQAMAWAQEHVGSDATTVAVHQARRLIVEPQSV